MTLSSIQAASPKLMQSIAHSQVWFSTSSCVPAAQGVESVDGGDPELLPRLGARRACSDGAQAKTLVVPEAGLLHQLLHGRLLWCSQGAAGWRLTVVWYWCTRPNGPNKGVGWTQYIYNKVQVLLSLTWKVIFFMPRPAASVAFLQRGLAASAHRDLSSHLGSFDDSLGKRPAGRTWQRLKHIKCFQRRRQTRRLVPWRTWSRCFALSAWAEWAEVSSVLPRKRRSWRWTEDSGSSAGASWRSPPSRSSPPRQKPPLSTSGGVWEAQRLM